MLGSGSRGNAVVVAAGGARLLLDAGFSCRELERRLAAVDVEPASVDAIVLTHEHDDHARGAERFSRKHELPVYASRGTLECRRLKRLAARARPFRAGDSLELGGLGIETFAVPHDAREPVGLVVEDGCGCRIALVGDLGSLEGVGWRSLRDLNGLILEANHDLEMLRVGPYPWSLKRRVASRHGHLSNRDAADGVAEVACQRLRFVVAYHLSEVNNMPALAQAAMAEALDRIGSRACLEISEQTRPTDWLAAGAATSLVAGP